jgi:glycosyltransferase involved in cell wall biosynthesis
MSEDSRRICHVTAHLRLGAGRAVVELARAQRRQGRSVLVAVASDVSDHWRSDRAMIAALEASGVTVATLGPWFSRDPIRMAEAAAQLRSLIGGAPFVAHAHLAPAILIGRRAGASTVLATCHGWNPDRAASYDAQDSAAYRACDVATSPSRFWAERLAGAMGAPRVELVPYGLDLSVEPAGNAGGNRDSSRIVSVCELTHRKGVDVLLDAIGMLWRRVPSATLHVIGTGDAEAALRAQAARLDSHGRRITFEGWIRNPRARHADFALFCLASRSDNYPLALMDAMLSGLPVVATRVGGIPEAVEASGCGAVVPPGDPQRLAEAMERLLTDTGAAATAGARGRAYARSHFDVGAVAHTFARLYQEHSGVLSPQPELS